MKSHYHVTLKDDPWSEPQRTFVAKDYNEANRAMDDMLDEYESAGWTFENTRATDKMLCNESGAILEIEECTLYRYRDCKTVDETQHI